MKHTDPIYREASKILQKHVPNRYSNKNSWVDAMIEFAEIYHRQLVKNNDGLTDVSKSKKCHAPKDYACRMAVYGCEKSHCGYYK